MTAPLAAACSAATVSTRVKACSGFSMCRSTVITTIASDDQQQLGRIELDQRAIAKRHRGQRPDHDAGDSQREHDVEGFAVDMAAGDGGAGELDQIDDRIPRR